MADGTAPEIEKPMAVPQPASTKPFWEHPLTITIVSFILTGVIGATVSYQIQSRNADSDRQAKRYEASTTAIAAFSDSLYTRYTRASFLASALKRHARADEVLNRKRLYDEAVVAQESGLFGKELLIREALQQPQYTSFVSFRQRCVKRRCQVFRPGDYQAI